MANYYIYCFRNHITVMTPEMIRVMRLRTNLMGIQCPVCDYEAQIVAENANNEVFTVISLGELFMETK